jgi:uncharacterized membrane protein
MKLFGHPLHLMLIHFPSALFPLDLVCSAAARFYSPEPLLQASKIALIGGTVMGWLAVIAGTFDLLGVMKNKPGSLKKALLHGGLNGSILAGYTVLSFLALKEPETMVSSLWILIFKSLFVAILLIGNFIGGNLVLKDKVLDEP